MSSLPNPTSASVKQIGAIAIRITGAGLGFLATLYATRLFGADLAGVFFASLAWAGFLAIIVRWGMQDVMLLLIPALQTRATQPQLGARVGSFFRRLFGRLAVVLGLSGLVWAIATSMEPDLNLSLVTILVMVAITSFLQMLSAVAKSLGKPVLAFAGELAIPPMLVLFALAFVFGSSPSLNLPGATAAYAFAGLIGLISLALVSWGTLARMRLSVPLPKRIVQRAGTFAMIELALFLTAFASIMLMPFLLSAQETGAFNLALRIVAVATLVPTSIAAVITPILVKAQRAGDEGQRSAALTQARIVMVLSALVYALGVYFFGPVALHWAGPGFAGAVTPMVIMMAGFTAGLLLGPTGVVLAVDGREAIARRIAIGAAVLTVAGLLIATPAYGMIGAAAVVGASFFLQRLVLFVAEQQSSSRR